MSISPSKKKYGNFKQTGWLFYALIACKLCYAQTDTTKQTKKSCENYYAPWHRTINDTAKWNVSKFGHYFSVGFGSGYDNGLAGLSLGASYSLAYKSHIVNMSYNYGGILGQGTTLTPSYNTKSIAILIGESIRLRHLLVSFSVGISSTNMYVYDPSYYIYSVRSGIIYSTAGGISFPIELKAFYLARNGIGVGFHVCENIVTTPKYSPFYACLSVVTGFWNKHKK